jgi:alkylated DNA repair dioxygenase AlkB
MAPLSSSATRPGPIRAGCARSPPAEESRTADRHDPKTRHSQQRHSGDFPASEQNDLFVAEPTRPGGLCHREDVILPDEHLAMVERYRRLPLKPFEFHGCFGKRRVASLGWCYQNAGGTLHKGEIIPAFLLPLGDRAAAFADVHAGSLEQILVTEYAPGAGIGWHRDKPMFEAVVAISFLPRCVLRFRRKQGIGCDRTSREMHPRSAYLLRGSTRPECRSLV